jgi:hypothetical protein
MVSAAGFTVTTRPSRSTVIRPFRKELRMWSV